jgi:hypothetical protein
MKLILARLECGHDADATLQEVGILQTSCYDRECRRPREIVSIITQEWLAFCYDCTFKRYFGDVAASAQEASRQHYLKHNDHRPGAKRASRPDSLKAQKIVDKRRALAR